MVSPLARATSESPWRFPGRSPPRDTGRFVDDGEDDVTFVVGFGRQTTNPRLRAGPEYVTHARRSPQKRSAPFRRLRRSLRRVGRTSHRLGPTPDGRPRSCAGALHPPRRDRTHGTAVTLSRPAEARREDTDGDVDARTADTGGDDIELGTRRSWSRRRVAQGVEVLTTARRLGSGAIDLAHRTERVVQHRRVGLFEDQRGRSMPSSRHHATTREGAGTRLEVDLSPARPTRSATRADSRASRGAQLDLDGRREPAQAPLIAHPAHERSL